MIELTRLQRQAVLQQQETPLLARDPDTEITSVLIPEAVYTQLKSLLQDNQDNQFLLSLRVQELFAQPDISLQKLMDDIGTEADAQGLTLDILENLLSQA